MFAPQQGAPEGPKFTESLGSARPSKLSGERTDSPGYGGSKLASPRQVDLRTILKTSRVEESLFNLAYITVHDNDLPPHLSWAFLFVEDIQWLAFAFSSALHKDIPAWLDYAFDPTRAITDYITFSYLNIATIVVVIGVVSLIAAITVVMQSRGKVPLFALRVLRILCALIMSALSIPIATFLFMGVHCVDGRLPKWGTQCFGATHLPLYVFDVISLIIFVPLLMLGVTLFIETDPASKSPVAKAHSRTDIIDVVVRLTLTLGDVMIGKADNAFQWTYMVLSVCLLTYLGWHTSRTQPYYNLATTSFRSGMCMATVMAMICSMFLRGLIGYDTNGYWVALLPSAAVGIVIGAGFAHGHNRHFLRRTVRTWHRILREEDSFKRAGSSEASLLLAPNAVSSSPFSITPASVPAPIPSAPNAANPDASLKRSRTTSAAAVLRSAPMSPAGGRGSLASALSRTSGTSPLKIAITAETSTESLPSNPPTPASVPTTPHTSSQNHESALDAPPLSPSTHTRTSPNLSRASRPSSPLVTSSLRDTLAETSSGSLLPAAATTAPQKRSMSMHKLPLAIPTAEESEKVIISVLRGTSTDALNAVRERQPRRRQNVFDSPLEVEVCIRFIRESPTDKQITIGLHLLERGLLEFPSDPMLLLLAATYLSTYYGQAGEKLADGLMKELESSRQVPLDVKFLGYCRERAQRSAGAHVLDKVALDSLDRESRQHHLGAMYALRDAWEAVRTHASAERLAEVASRLAYHRSRALSCYTRLLARNARSKDSLRLFASYLQTVEHDGLRAQQIIDLADDFEAREARDHHHLSGEAMTGSLENLSVPSLPASSDSQMAEKAEKSRGVNGDSTETSLSLFSGALDVGSPHTIAAGTMNRATFHSNVPNSSGRPKVSSHVLARSTSHHGSETSGTSTSRGQRQRSTLRRLMELRLTRPLHGAWQMGGFILVFLAALVIGFVLCLNFMDVSNASIGTDFTQTRIGRRAVILIVEGIRRMVYGSAVNNSIEYQAGVTTVRFNYNSMIATVLPVLNRLEAANQASTPRFRLYNRIAVNASRTDYIPLLLSPTELANIVLQAGALALGYTSNGSMTPAIANAIPELYFLSDNLFTIFAASKELPVTGIRAYNQIGSQVTLFLTVIMVTSLLALVAVGLVVYFRVTLAYFDRESQVHGLLLSVHAKVASSLAADMEEEIEGFREIMQDDEAHQLDHSLTDLTNSGKGGSLANDSIRDSTPPPSSKARGSATAPRAVRRQSKYTTPLVLSVVGISAIVVALFTVTLGSFQVQADLDRLLGVSDRRYFANALRVFGRELVSSDFTVPKDPLLQNMRSTLTEADDLHQRLLNDPDGLSIQVPELTALPRNCTLPTSCTFVPENAVIGFTRATASLPFNTQCSRLIETGRYFVDQMLDANARETVRSSAAFNKWLLMEALSLDVEDRSRELEIGTGGRLMARLATSRSWIIGTFVLVIIASIVAFILFIVLGVNSLKRDAAVLVLLLHMVPANALKDMPELARFMETGGLTLMT